MRNPEELYTWHRDVEFDTPPVLVHAFSGFVDAGNGVRIAADHILESCDQHLIATFDQHHKRFAAHRAALWPQA
jgi:hypothetical protein